VVVLVAVCVCGGGGRDISTREVTTPLCIVPNNKGFNNCQQQQQQQLQVDAMMVASPSMALNIRAISSSEPHLGVKKAPVPPLPQPRITQQNQLLSSSHLLSQHHKCASQANMTVAFFCDIGCWQVRQCTT
jgi:hypothetical protein